MLFSFKCRFFLNCLFFRYSFKPNILRWVLGKLISTSVQSDESWRLPSLDGTAHSSAEVWWTLAESNNTKLVVFFIGTSCCKTRDCLVYRKFMMCDVMLFNPPPLSPLLSSPGLSFICLHHLCANLLCERVTGWHRQVIIISSSNTTEQQTSLFQHKVRL